MRRIVVVFVIASLAILAWLVWTQQRRQPFTVSGFIEADEVRVGSRVGGRVAEVLVEEGDVVKPGQVLFRLDPFDLHEQLARAKGELAAAQAEHERLAAGFRVEEIEQARARRDRFAALLEKLVAGPRAQEIEVARQNLAEARAELEWAQREHQRVAGLREAKQAGDTEWNMAERARKTAEARAQAAAQQLALLEEGTRAEEIAEARANLAEAEQALRLAGAV